YASAAGRTAGNQNAASSFALAAGNTNPQDIADPPTEARSLTVAASVGAPNQAAVEAFNAVPLVAPCAALGVPAPASRDAVFALLGRDPLPGGTTGRVLAGAALMPHLDGATPVAAAAWTSAPAAGGQNPLALVHALPLENRQGVH